MKTSPDEPTAPKASPALPPALQEVVDRWENTTRQTLGPMLSTESYNALNACLAGLRSQLAAAGGPS